jgi:hypothetical protein
MEAESTSETSGQFYHTMWCHIPQDMIFINTTITTYQHNTEKSGTEVGKDEVEQGLVKRGRIWC